jgi:hypothetical protein
MTDNEAAKESRKAGSWRKSLTNPDLHQPDLEALAALCFSFAAKSFSDSLS